MLFPLILYSDAMFFKSNIAGTLLFNFLIPETKQTDVGEREGTNFRNSTLKCIPGLMWTHADSCKPFTHPVSLNRSI